MFGLKKLVQSILNNVRIQTKESVNQTEWLAKIHLHTKHQSSVLDQLLQTQLAMGVLQKKTFTQDEERVPENEEELAEYEAQQLEHENTREAFDEMYINDISNSAEG